MFRKVFFYQKLIHFCQLIKFGEIHEKKVSASICALFFNVPFENSNISRDLPQRHSEALLLLTNAMYRYSKPHTMNVFWKANLH